MNRRDFGKGTLALAGIAALGLPVLTMTGCSAQGTIAALLNEMETAWAALLAATGKVLPASIQADFAAAVAAVKAWKAGTPAQDVVEALQILANDVAPLVPMTPLEAAAVQVILRTIVNIIEEIDPAAAPAQAAKKLARKNAANVVNPLNSDKEARRIKATFESDWKNETGPQSAF
jgi:hypothetical protein